MNFTMSQSLHTILSILQPVFTPGVEGAVSLALIVLLFQKEVLRFFDGYYPRRVRRVLMWVIVPLFITFILVIALRFAELLQ